MDPMQELQCGYGRWAVVQPNSWRKLYFAVFETEGADALAAVMHAGPETFDLGGLAKRQEDQAISARIEGAALDWVEPIFAALGSMPEDDRPWQFRFDDEEDIADLKAKIERSMTSSVSVFARSGGPIDAYKVTRWLEDELALTLDMSVFNAVHGIIVKAAPLFDRASITEEEILAAVRNTEAGLCERSNTVTTTLSIWRENRSLTGPMPG